MKQVARTTIECLRTEQGSEGDDDEGDEGDDDEGDDERLWTSQTATKTDNG